MTPQSILSIHFPRSFDIINVLRTDQVVTADQARRGVLRISASLDRSDMQPIAPRRIAGHDGGETGTGLWDVADWTGRSIELGPCDEPGGWAVSGIGDTVRSIYTALIWVELDAALIPHIALIHNTIRPERAEAFDDENFGPKFLEKIAQHIVIFKNRLRDQEETQGMQPRKFRQAGSAWALDADRDR